MEKNSVFDLPLEGYTVKRSSGCLEHDWCCQGQIQWSQTKQCPAMRVYKTGCVEGYDTGSIWKWVVLREFLELNPQWTDLAKQLCEITDIPFIEKK